MTKEKTKLFDAHDWIENFEEFQEEPDADGVFSSGPYNETIIYKSGSSNRSWYPIYILILMIASIIGGAIGFYLYFEVQGLEATKSLVAGMLITIVCLLVTTMMSILIERRDFKL